MCWGFLTCGGCDMVLGAHNIGSSRTFSIWDAVYQFVYIFIWVNERESSVHMKSDGREIIRYSCPRGEAETIPTNNKFGGMQQTAVG